MSKTITTSRCPECGKTSNFVITNIQYEMMVSFDGPLIQDIFPEMLPEDRETLITGTHPECWKKIFADITDEEPIAPQGAESDQ